MAIVGGAILRDTGGNRRPRRTHHAFVLPVLCYLYIVFYALKGSKPNSERYTNA